MLFIGNLLSNKNVLCCDKLALIHYLFKSCCFVVIDFPFPLACFHNHINDIGSKGGRKEDLGKVKRRKMESRQRMIPCPPKESRDI